MKNNKKELEKNQYVDYITSLSCIISNKKLKYKSSLEQKVAYELKKGKFDFQYEGAIISYRPIKKYKPDFIIQKIDGTQMYIECKGWLRKEDKKKMEDIRNEYPTLDIRLVFGCATNRINKKTNMLYWEWAEKYGFKWCDKQIPKEWFKEML